MISPAPLLKHQFHLWLNSQSYQPSTIKNYLADINRYLQYLQTSSSSPVNPFTLTAIKSYISFVSADSNVRRYLASLNKFCQFALDQKLINANPVKKIIHTAGILSDQSDINHLIEQYSLSLQSHKSATTIKNYLNDLKNFIQWSDTQSDQSSLDINHHP